MARYLFNLPPVQPTQTVRLDTASGSDSPAADVTMPDGTAVSATLTSGHDGLLPEVYSGSATLYLKRLTYGGTVTGSPQTLTGSNQSPSAPTSGAAVESVVAGSGISVDATDPANPIVAATGGGSGQAHGAQFSFAFDTAGLVDGVDTGIAIPAGSMVDILLASPADWVAGSAAFFAVSDSAANAVDDAANLNNWVVSLAANHDTALPPFVVPASSFSGVAVSDADAELWIAVQASGGGDPVATAGTATLFVRWTTTL